MAADSFTEAMHRLKEIHDKEVLGMQAKLTELTLEKCRDAQRIEELFSKNHILREQHKVLNENIKVLENRLRAGLCDRCTVTQELAKKKQQEFEKAHFHNLQQISSLTGEMKSLREENRSLLEELKKLNGLDEKNTHPKTSTPEPSLDSDSPHSQTSSVGQKNGLEKTKKDVEPQENLSDGQVEEEKCRANQRLSPGIKTFQAASNDVRHLEMKVLLGSQNQQRISNQLHGTIAVLRSKGGQSGTGSSPAHNKRTSTNEQYAKGSSSHYYDASTHLESLNQATPEERFCLLGQRLAQRHLGERGPAVFADGTGPNLLAKNHEAILERKQTQDDWEDRVAMVELRDALLYMREHGYRGRMVHPNHRDRLQFFLTRQHQGQRSQDEAQRSQQRDSLDERELSLLQVLSAHWKNSKFQDQTEEQDWDKKDTYVETEQREQDEESTPDIPLDLSDTKRVQPSHISDNMRENRGKSEIYSARTAFRNNSISPTGTLCTDTGQASRQDDVRSAANILVNELGRESRTCSDRQDFQDTGRDANPFLEKNDDSKRPPKGQKRDREIEAEESDQAQSPEEEEDTGTSCSETEVDSQKAQSETPHEISTNDKIREKNKQRKVMSQVSKKPVKRKKTLLGAESDRCQDDKEEKITT
ncbi:RBBP8 N-terminal-like protein isoform X2 [Spea bombifrons]|uniref:RBBP8 N-terminal-like protein isoform X2 n=1 Tax=Spea bombifrons TaxID=233779 RepID=UPI00234B352E|nr:RBBP8 N-terminal-like protein isoform X2 [Spea bombifrons]